MRHFRHTQPARSVPVILGIGGVVLVSVALAEGGSRSVALWVAAVLGVAIYLFSSMTVEVTDADITLWFGPGFLRKRFPVDEVTGVAVVRNPWYWGLGVHWTPRGWLYNIAGPDAVEVELGARRRVRIGSDEAPRLAAAIREARRLP